MPQGKGVKGPREKGHLFIFIQMPGIPAQEVIAQEAVKVIQEGAARVEVQLPCLFLIDHQHQQAFVGHIKNVPAISQRQLSVAKDGPAQGA